MKQSLLTKCLAYVALIVVVAVFIFPIFWMFRMSLMPQALVYEYPPVLLFVPTLKNYQDILLSKLSVFSRPYANYFANSVEVSLLATVMGAGVGTLGGYGLARFQFRSSRSVSFYILSALFAPPAAYVIPLFLMIRSIHLLDTQLGLALIYLTFTIPFTTWLMIGIIKDVPVEIEESAMIDGCSRIGVLTRVTFPLIRTGLVAAAIFDVILCWNEFTFASILTSVNSETLPVTIAAFGSSGAVKPIEWGYVAASAVLVMLPILIFAFFVQKQIVRGFALGAVKG